MKRKERNLEIRKAIFFAFSEFRIQYTPTELFKVVSKKVKGVSKSTFYKVLKQMIKEGYLYVLKRKKRYSLVLNPNVFYVFSELGYLKFVAQFYVSFLLKFAEKVRKEKGDPSTIYLIFRKMLNFLFGEFNFFLVQNMLNCKTKTDKKLLWIYLYSYVYDVLDCFIFYSAKILPKDETTLKLIEDIHKSKIKSIQRKIKKEMVKSNWVKEFYELKQKYVSDFGFKMKLYRRALRNKTILSKLTHM